MTEEAWEHDPNHVDDEAAALDDARRISAEDLGWEMDGEEDDDSRLNV